MKQYIKKSIPPFFIGLTIGIIATFPIARVNNTHSNDHSEQEGYHNRIDERLNNNKYQFTKPLLNSDFGEEKETLKWFPTERQLKNTIQDITAENPDIETAVFFLNLDNSGWFSVNANNTFIPASLLKLPMLLSYYKLREQQKDLFEQIIVYQGTDYNNQRKVGNLGNGYIKSGEKYTIKELLNEMIVNSDNNALELLYEYRKDSLRNIFSDLNIALPKNDTEIATNDFMTVRDISRFLLVLYNASYLSAEDSDEALKILSKSTYKEGLVSGVPDGIPVSHKFGERELDQNLTTKNIELHDCGIIYHPQIPYITCVMTKGQNLELQKAQIQKISKTIYSAITNYTEPKLKK